MKNNVNKNEKGVAFSEQCNLCDTANYCIIRSDYVFKMLRFDKVKRPQ